MVQQVKAFTTKADDLGLIPGRTELTPVVVL